MSHPCSNTSHPLRGAMVAALVSGLAGHVLANDPPDAYLRFEKLGAEIIREACRPGEDLMVEASCNGVIAAERDPKGLVLQHNLEYAANGSSASGAIAARYTLVSTPEPARRFAHSTVVFSLTPVAKAGAEDEGCGISDPQEIGYEGRDVLYLVVGHDRRATIKLAELEHPGACKARQFKVAVGDLDVSDPKEVAFLEMVLEESIRSASMRDAKGFLDQKAVLQVSTASD